MSESDASSRANARLEAHPEYCSGCAHYGGYCGMCSCSSMFTIDWGAIFVKYLLEESLLEESLLEESLKEEPLCGSCKAPHTGLCYSLPYLWGHEG